MPTASCATSHVASLKSNKPPECFMSRSPLLLHVPGSVSLTHVDCFFDSLSSFPSLTDPFWPYLTILLLLGTTLLSPSPCHAVVCFFFFIILCSRFTCPITASFKGCCRHFDHRRDSRVWEKITLNFLTKQITNYFYSLYWVSIFLSVGVSSGQEQAFRLELRDLSSLIWQWFYVR